VIDDVVRLPKQLPKLLMVLVILALQSPQKLESGIDHCVAS